MNNDELFNRKLYNLRNDIQDYINNYYLKEISSEYLQDLIVFLEKYNENDYMLNNITIGLAIEGTLSLDKIEKSKIDREIGRILFEIYIENILSNTNFENIKILYADNIKKKYKNIELIGLIKAYLVDNIRELYNNGISHLNDFSFYVYDDGSTTKIKIYETKEVLKIIH